MFLSKLREKLPKLPSPLINWLGHEKFRRLLSITVFFFITMVILSIHFLPERVPLEEGQVSPKDIIAKRYLTFENEDATEQKRFEVTSHVKDEYVLKEEVLNNTIGEMGTIFSEILAITADINRTDNEKIASLKNLNLSLSNTEWNKIIALDPIKINALSNHTKSILNKVFAKGVKSEDIKFAKSRAVAEVDLLELEPVHRSLIKNILNSIEYKPNLVYDPVATEKLKREAANEVEPVQVVIKKGQRIVSEGDILNKHQIEVLTWLGYKKNASPLIILTGLALFTGLVILLVGLFLQRYRKDLYRDSNKLVLLMLLVIITLIIIKIFLSMTLSQIPERAAQVGHLVPIAAGSMLIAMLLDLNLAIFITSIFALIIGIMTGEMSFALTAFVGGVVAVYSVSRLNQRSDLAKAGLWVAIVNVISVLSLALLYGQNWPVTLTGVSFGVVNGLVSSIMTIGLLPYLESLFGITTSVRLLELANPNHPLLKRLLLEATGTYHHSILVGNLAEAAAEEIGADSLIVRVGAYYHDIGKIKRPYFFVENQMGNENPHDKITASLSTLIITSHVKDGVELAKEHGLPKVITDIIAQHHGTSLIKFFYHKAKETEKDDLVKEEDFRHIGPKPQNKEMALIMLADSIEAAVRSIKEPTPGKIEGMIRNIIKDRLNDDQFDECDLTFKDLDKIANSFVRVLGGIYHSRIEYPDNALKAIEKKKKKGETHATDNKE
ncbi:hypothetical protein SAMN00017405_1396 [Desulfonispora thiosulfatigenes DSM 11270]|uniref:HD domain-containing protein n=1 Tax=Desulfonispora thiosulfatigenes DSM 11270 TaxID=656914 RepID=A0A1W1VDF8_DESTI|nr:HDIG domain-containing metalloprotein [Desulfonispora thiosulfatigenes]SMB90984.1 hypothetical protein SAMN00017405_1396 [Desulfonispora thiosulfatigenes DSM 11270]